MSQTTTLLNINTPKNCFLDLITPVRPPRSQVDTTSCHAFSHIDLAAPESLRHQFYITSEVLWERETHTERERGESINDRIPLGIFEELEMPRCHC